MNLLYISRHTYIQGKDGSICSTGMMGNSYFEKYLRYFDTVTVLGYLCTETESNASKKVGRPIQNTDEIRYCLAPSDGRSYRSLVSSAALKSLTKEEIQKADAVLCKSASAAAFAAAYAKKYHKPYMVEVVGCVWDSLWNHSLKGKILAVPSYLSLRSVVRKAPFVLYVTTKFLQRRYPTHGRSASISDVELQPAGGDVLKRRLEKIQNHTGIYRIGTAGALHVPYKGQQYVIEALANLKKKGITNFEYHLAGGGDHARLSDLADKLGVTNQVIFDGSLPHDEMFSWLDELDVYLQPSSVEGMPRALIEAMSRGLPSFGSRVGGIPELLGTEAVFPIGDTAQIAKMLAGLNKKNIEKAAVRNYEHAKRFQKDELEQQRDAFYSAFADTARRNCEEKAQVNKPVRVLHVFAALDTGGVSNFVMNLYRAVDTEKIQFDFAMTSGQKSLYDDEAQSRGARIYYFDPSKSVRSNIRKILKSNTYDAVHSHVFFYSGLVLLEAKRAKVPLRIAHAHNAHTGESRSLARLAYEKIMRSLIRRYATVLLGCSEKACRYVFGENIMSDPRALVLPDGIDYNRFAFQPEVREQVRKTYGLDGKYVVGHVGHFNAAKNHEKILSVFAEVCRRRTDAALLLVGDGKMEKDIRDRANALGLADKVVFAGSHRDVERFYQAMDVFLFPSLYEGFGMAMIEAEAGGLACLASDVVTKETKLSEAARYLSLDQDSSVWADTLLDLPPRSTDLALNKANMQKYDSLQVAEEYEELITRNVK